MAEVARLLTLEISSKCRFGFVVIAAANKLQPEIGQPRDFRNYKVLTRHSNIYIRRKAINRRSIVAIVRSRNDVVNEIAMPVIYLPVKPIRDVRKLLITDTDRRFHQVGA